MNNPEHDIEKLLTALRDVKTPPGIERRILQTLHQRSATHATSRWRSLRWAAPRPWVLATTMAGAIAACLAVFAFHRVAQVPPTRQPSYVTSVDPSPTTNSNRATNISQPMSVPAAISKANPHPLHSISSANSLALSDMRAPNHPAPPMPLTEQERLLLRIVRSGAHQELATLSLERRARLDADEAAAFQNFFEPARQQPKPGDNE